MRILTKLSLSLIVLLIAISQAEAKKLYKWVAEDGTIYYSDKVPPKDITRAHKELSGTGVQIKSHGAAKTPEEIAKEHQEKLLREQQQRLLDEQRAKDMTLLKTFRSVDDIILARDGKLATYDTQIKMTHKNIVNLKSRLLMLQERAAQYERQGQKPNEKLVTSIDNTESEIRDNYASILRREKDKEIIHKEYAESITRFRELKDLKEENLEQSGSDRTDINAVDFSLVDTAVVCEDSAQCDRYWKTARDYGKQHATTKTQVDAANIYLSKPPVSANDVSVTVSRVRPTRLGKEVIFLDIKCKNTITGIELCQSKEMETVRRGFKSAVIGKK